MQIKLLTRLAILTTGLLLPGWAFSQSVTDLTVGSQHFCSLDNAGIVSCTARAGETRLLEPEGLPALSAIAAGDQHTCGITIDGGAVCWGANFLNQLDVPALNAPLISIAAGFNHTCALDTNGDAICWGLNTNLQLEPPVTDGGFVSIDASRNYSCGITTNGDLTCWTNDFEISRNSVTPGPFIASDSSRTDRCGLTGNGDITCARFLSVPTSGPYIDLTVGPLSVCGLTQDGRLDCEIGFSVLDQFAEEIAAVSANVRFTAIESSQVGSNTNRTSPICGIRADDGTVMCFGGDRLPTSADAIEVTGNLVSEIDLSLSVLAYSSSTVELFWNAQPNQIPQIFIEIFRDGELLTTTDAMFSFFDSDVVTQTQSTYVIRATDSAGNTGPFSNEITISRENLNIIGSSTDTGITNPRENNTLRIENLTVLAPGFFAGNSTGTVILNWELLNEAEVSVAGYEIRQNNTTLAFTRNNVYTNNNVSSDFCGTFSVLAIGDDGQILESTSAPLILPNQSTCR